MHSAAVNEPRARTTYAPGKLELVRALRREGFLGFLMNAWRTHGDLARIELGNRALQLVVHPDHVRHVTVEHRDRYDKGASYQNVREHLLGEGIVVATGESWRRQRKLMAPFFSTVGIQKYFPIFVDDTARLAERWSAGPAATGAPVNMFEEMMGVTAAVILHSVFTTSTGPELDEVKHHIERMIGHISRLSQNPLQMPLWVPTTENRRFRRAQRQIDRYIRGLIAARRAVPEAERPPDLLSDLMKATDEDGSSLAEQLLVDNGVTLFAAGHETTARTLSFLWFALARNPDVEARLHAEVDAVLDGGAPTVEQLKRLPYTLQVVREVLRLYPAAPIYSRDAVTDDEIDGVRIEPGLNLLLFPYATQRHPAFWKDPERFDPDRWTPEQAEARHPQAFHAFASGPRICLGNSFSLLETHVMTAMLARRFRARVVPGHVPLLEFNGTLGMRGGLPMTIERR